MNMEYLHFFRSLKFLSSEFSNFSLINYIHVLSDLDLHILFFGKWYYIFNFPNFIASISESNGFLYINHTFCNLVWSLISWRSFCWCSNSFLFLQLWPLETKDSMCLLSQSLYVLFPFLVLFHQLEVLIQDWIKVVRGAILALCPIIEGKNLFSHHLIWCSCGLFEGIFFFLIKLK